MESIRLVSVPKQVHVLVSLLVPAAYVHHFCEVQCQNSLCASFLSHSTPDLGLYLEEGTNAGNSNIPHRYEIKRRRMLGEQIGQAFAIEAPGHFFQALRNKTDFKTHSCLVFMQLLACIFQFSQPGFHLFISPASELV